MLKAVKVAGVNFTNILRATFLCESFAKSFFTLFAQNTGDFK
jgi:hypothetical protein